MNNHVEPVNLRPCPSDYEPSSRFLESVAGFLAPTYTSKAQEIEKKSGSGFIQQWAWEAEKLRKEAELDEEYGEIMHFLGGHGRPILTGMSTKISEIYKSAFSRALALFYKSGKIPSEIFLYYSLSTCPIDLTFWEIQPQRPPSWWPSLSSKSKSTIDTSVSEVWQSLDDLVNHFGLGKSENGKKILAACGPVKPAKGWELDKLNIDFTMLGFAYRVNGASFPKAEEVIDNLYKPVWFPATGTSKPLCFFESTNDLHCSMELEGFLIDDLVIMPLVASLKTNSINLWQWFREHYSPRGLSYGLVCKGATLKHKHNGWVYTFERKEVAFGYNWLSGIVERHDKDLPIPSGQVLEIDGKWLHDILNNGEFKLGYVIKVTSRVKEYSYGEAKIFEDAKFFGVSPIIHPA
ncbi:MAG: hypothetical protein GY800_13185 [Planctomycetes bacterium]|nr:hypothetical protein [Planctomycetota bacterium]